MGIISLHPFAYLLRRKLEIVDKRRSSHPISLFSAFKFVGRWSLEECNPWLHLFFGDVETCLRRLRISYRKSVHQLIRRHIEKMYFTTGPKLLRSRPIVFTFLSCPKAEIEYDTRSQFKCSTCYVPKHGFNEVVPGVMFWLLSILTEKRYLPFVWCQSKGRFLTLKLLRKRGFPRTRKSNHQMESRHPYYSWISPIR